MSEPKRMNQTSDLKDVGLANGAAQSICSCKDCPHNQQVFVREEGQLRYELRRFCETTTVKGVRRTITSASLWLKTTWIVAVFCCLGLALIHSYFLFYEYLHYPSVINIEEDVLRIRTDPDQNTLPALTVCNTQPLTKRSSAYQGLLTYPQYVEKYEQELFAELNVNDPTYQILNQNRDLLFSTTGYYQYLGNAAIDVSHAWEELVVSCDVVVTEATRSTLRPCRDFLIISHISDAMYFNCYTMQPKSYSTNETVIGYSLILYVGADVSWTSSSYNGIDPLKFSKGALFGLHEPDALPFMGSYGISAAPGNYIWTKIVLEKRERLGGNYGNCVNGTDGFILPNGRPLRYTYNSCRHACIEAAIVSDCQCRDSGTPYVRWNEHANLTFCSDVKANATLLASRLQCAIRSRMDHMLDCYLGCQLPCRQADYYPIISHFDWPELADVEAFYNDFINGTAVQDLFGTVEELTGGECSNLRSSCPFVSQVADMIKANFLVIRPQLYDQRYIIVASKVALTWTNLISQLGGALNLWAGISVVVFVEMLELFLRLVMPALYVNKK